MTTFEQVRALIKDLHADATNEALAAEDFVPRAMKKIEELSELVDGLSNRPSWTVRERTLARNAAQQAYESYHVHTVAARRNREPAVELWWRVASAVLDAVEHRLYGARLEQHETKR